MLSIEQMRKIDPGLIFLDYREVEKLRATLYETAQAAFDIWWSQKDGSKNPTGLLPGKELDEKI